MTPDLAVICIMLWAQGPFMIVWGDPCFISVEEAAFLSSRAPKAWHPLRGGQPSSLQAAPAYVSSCFTEAHLSSPVGS